MKKSIYFQSFSVGLEMNSLFNNTFAHVHKKEIGYS